MVFHRIMAYSHSTGPGRDSYRGQDSVPIYYAGNVHTGPNQFQEPDPMSPIVLVPFRVPVQVPFLCNVNKPL